MSSKSIPGNISADDQARYEQLLAESSNIKGTSQWQDAMKRLRRDRAAMISFYFLIATCLSAIFAPVLPLQSPVVQNLNNQFKPPSRKPVSLIFFEAAKESKEELKQIGLVQKLREFNEEVVAIRDELKLASGDERKKLQTELNNKYEIDHPFFKVWNQPGWLTRQMYPFAVWYRRTWPRRPFQSLLGLARLADGRHYRNTCLAGNRR
jgi:oligopeptide transport system permease protein